MSTRKRDRFFGRFRPHQGTPSPTNIQQPSTAPTQSPTQASGVPSVRTTPSIRDAQWFLDEALSALGEKEREIIQDSLGQGSQDIRVVVQQSYDAAQSHKHQCENKRWRWSFRGQDVILREKAEKVIIWLDRFKSVGDVVANIAPLHVGLPWAGIRVILEVTVSDSHQMAALLIGMDLVLSLISRLEVYLRYYGRIPATQAMANFEKAIVKTYAHVLRFLALAIQLYQRGTRGRMLGALWSTSALESFASESGQLCMQLEIEASICDREISAVRWANAKVWKDELTAALRNLDNLQGIQRSLASLHVKADLSKLTVVKSAAYNSYDDGITATCLQGTRTDLLSQITTWANNSSGTCIYWLCGVAGTGKSTIARTVAETFDRQNRLGASFFFKRGEGDRGSGRLFFPTIALQIADRIPGIDQSMAEALAADSLLSGRNLQDQFEKLLLQPLLHATSGSVARSEMVIVIDALDECEREDDVWMLIFHLARLHGVTSYRLRIFVTSRPELPIRLGFHDIDGSLHQDIKLEEVQATTIEQDIRTYFKYQLELIRKEDFATQGDHPLPASWPGNDAIEALVRLAVPLFIFAFTACRYISEEDPQERLETILDQSKSATLSGLEKTYLPILSHLIIDKDQRERKQVVEDFQEFVGAIILLADPLAAQPLSSLLIVSPRTVQQKLKRLHSVLDIPGDTNAPIRIFHLSFRDFLVDRCNESVTPFWIDERRRHGRLAQQCIERLKRDEALKADLLSIGKPGVRRRNVDIRQIEEHIPQDVAYACCYWVYHLLESKQGIHDGGEVHEFLATHFLHWLEALSWLGKLSNAVAYISEIRSAVREEAGPRIASFLDDAKRFVLWNRYVVDLAPIQLYYAALVFTPTESVIRRSFKGQYTRLLCKLPEVSAKWSAEVQKLEGHDGGVRAVAFSPDGLTVASASGDRTVRLWDAKTGEERQKLTGHDDWVNAVAFSSDGQTMASASDDGTVRLWDAKTGEERQKLVGHDGWVHAAAFSPDGETVASASSDQTVRLWDTKTGEEQRKLTGHDGSVHAVAFSPGGKTVASASYDRTVRLWDAKTGEERRKLVGHDGSVHAVAFSLDGTTVASASYDRTVRLWDAKTGEQRRKLTGHDDRVNTVAFSPDGETVASASGDGTVRLWDAKTGEQIRRFEALGIRRINFTVDGQSLETDKGLFDLDFCSRPVQIPTHPRTTSVLLSGEWLKLDNEDELWLPHEYRGSASAIDGKLIVIGRASGAITFIEFR